MPTSLRTTFTGTKVEAPWSIPAPGYYLGVERYTADPDVVKVGGGHLALTAVRDPDGSWRSGMVHTKDSLRIQNGRVQVRMKLPTGQGIWPAFWLNDYDPDVEHPATAEIDVVETISDGTTFFGTAHRWEGGHWSKGVTAPLKPGWHTYGVDWRRDAITWLLDGKPVGSLKRSQVPIWVFDRPLHLILTLAVGGDWPGPPDDTTPATATMLVDWVDVTF